MARPCASTAGLVRICSWLLVLTVPTGRLATPHLLFSRLPKLMKSSADLEAVALSADVAEEVLRDREVRLPEHRHHHAVALSVLAAVLAQILVLLDVGLERRGLLGGRERARADGERREVHLGLVARDVDQVVGATLSPFMSPANT